MNVALENKRGERGKKSRHVEREREIERDRQRQIERETEKNVESLSWR